MVYFAQADTYVSYSSTLTDQTFTVAFSSVPSVPGDATAEWSIWISKYGPGPCTGGAVWIDGVEVWPDLGSVSTQAITYAAPIIGPGYVEVVVEVLGSTRSGGGFWSIDPNNYPYQFYWTAESPSEATDRPYLRQRQSPLWVPSRNSDAYRLRNNQTPYL